MIVNDSGIGNFELNPILYYMTDTLLIPKIFLRVRKTRDKYFCYIDKTGLVIRLYDLVRPSFKLKNQVQFYKQEVYKFLNSKGIPEEFIDFMFKSSVRKKFDTLSEVNQYIVKIEQYLNILYDITNNHVCKKCGKHTFNSVLCDECIEEESQHLIFCSECGLGTEQKNSFKIGLNGKIYCPKCFAKYYFECPECHRISKQEFKICECGNTKKIMSVQYVKNKLENLLSELSGITIHSYNVHEFADKTAYYSQARYIEHLVKNDIYFSNYRTIFSTPNNDVEQVVKNTALFMKRFLNKPEYVIKSDKPVNTSVLMYLLDCVIPYLTYYCNHNYNKYCDTYDAYDVAMKIKLKSIPSQLIFGKKFDVNTFSNKVYSSINMESVNKSCILRQEGENRYVFTSNLDANKDKNLLLLIIELLELSSVIDFNTALNFDIQQLLYKYELIS